MNEAPRDWQECIKSLPPQVPDAEVEAAWRDAVASLPHKIIVLDDDPTGVQTVYDVPVYTRWDAETLREAVRDSSRVVFILTNSRALSEVQTATLHAQLGRDLQRVADEEAVPLLLISRSDSTLRGHYPLETQTLRAALQPFQNFDGEILIPFFGEGGRLTLDDVHYVREGETLIPAGQTEFARDATFGYKASNLKAWVAEKTNGMCPAEHVISVSLQSLRRQDIGGIAQQLLQAHEQTIIVNAAAYSDLKVFAVALAQAWQAGRRFLFRSAASWVQVVAGMEARPCLSAQDFPKSVSPGLIIVGSHTAKTTRQMEELRPLDNLQWIECRVLEAQTAGRWQAEIARVTAATEAALSSGCDVCLFTSRDYHGAPEAAGSALAFSTRVSQGLARVVAELSVAPGFLVAKGGITSSDVGVHGLNVRRALVMGQIAPGVPVWKLGEESRFPCLPYVIFPGNVGDDGTLRRVVELLRWRHQDAD